MSAGAIPGRGQDGRGTEGRGPGAGPDRRQFILGGGLLAAAAAGVALRPRRLAEPLKDGTLDRLVPHRIGPYDYLTASGVVLPPSDELTERIYDQVLTRVYVADGLPPMMLLIAYGSAQDATLMLHRPDTCYPAAGFRLSGERHVPVALGAAGTQTVNFVTAQRNERIEQILFWSRIGDRFPITQHDEKMSVFLSNLTGAMPDGVLVRLSSLLPNPADALRGLDLFNRQLLASMGAEGRRILLGL